jgi:hypothetical protein
MKHILYTLSMPNVGSWDGKFTGAGKFYGVVRSYSAKSAIPAKVLSRGSYYYNFGDGWGASVSCTAVTGKQKPGLKKASAGFMHYDWMIDEIETYGRIKTLAERKADKAHDNPLGKEASHDAE